VSEHPKKIRPEQAASPAERRRVGTVVHDDRGNAKVEWRAAPADEERPVLELLGEDGASRRTDLRKLSEWIKKMRELEERKREDEDPQEK
jgi:hypothetical protein